MSAVFRVRLAPRPALATGALLLGLLSGPAWAEDGIIIPLPPAQYVNLPSNDGINDPRTTGGLPNTSSLGLRSLSGFQAYVAKGAITLRASTPVNCLPGNLRAVLADVAAKFGTVSIQSTHRSRSHNRRAGGARHSLHLSCRAIDFRVRTRIRGVMAYLRSRAEVGGLKIYRNGLIHIDNGSRRTW
jgi:hypothetical protein